MADEIIIPVPPDELIEDEPDPIETQLTELSTETRTRFETITERIDTCQTILQQLNTRTETENPALVQLQSQLNALSESLNFQTQSLATLKVTLESMELKLSTLQLSQARESERMEPSMDVPLDADPEVPAEVHPTPATKRKRRLL